MNEITENWENLGMLDQFEKIEDKNIVASQLEEAKNYILGIGIENFHKEIDTFFAPLIVRLNVNNIMLSIDIKSLIQELDTILKRVWIAFEYIKTDINASMLFLNSFIADIEMRFSANDQSNEI